MKRSVVHETDRSRCPRAGLTPREIMRDYEQRFEQEIATENGVECLSPPQEESILIR